MSKILKFRKYFDDDFSKGKKKKPERAEIAKKKREWDNDGDYNDSKYHAHKTYGGKRYD